MSGTSLNIELLLIIACLVAIGSRRARLPYTVGLVVTGLLLSHLNLAPQLHLSRDLIFAWLLPPLVFESALHLSWRDVKAQLPVVSFLATIGVFAAALISASILVWTVGLAWPTAITIGIVLSATDPVSVLALLKEAKLPPRIRRLIEAESLLNDGTAAALFALAPLVIAGSAGLGSIISLSAISICGGIIIGAIVGGLSIIIAARTDDYLVEVTVTMVAAFGSFLLAEHLHTSGILATLAAGMLFGNLHAANGLTERGREAAEDFWELAGFLANSTIFLLIGVDLDDLQPEHHIATVLATIGACLISRALIVYAGCVPFNRSPCAVSRPVRHLLFWGGLRGALALALVLGLDPAAPDTPIIKTAVFYAVAFSIIVQGLTVGPLIRSVQAAESPPTD